MLSHPLIVEAAETLFVPACVHNNTTGDADHEVLQSFGEPAWNNPVVRILDADRKDLVPRNGRDWTVAGVAGAMVRALAKTGREVPEYLSLLARESAAREAGLETAIFGMA